MIHGADVDMALDKDTECSADDDSCALNALQQRAVVSDENRDERSLLGARTAVRDEDVNEQDLNEDGFAAKGKKWGGGKWGGGYKKAQKSYHKAAKKWYLLSQQNEVESDENRDERSLLGARTAVRDEDVNEE